MFKRLTSEDYNITPFTAHKRFVVESDEESNKRDQISELIGVNYSFKKLLDKESEPRNGTDGPFYRHVYDLINHFYYKHDFPHQLFGIEDVDNVILDRFRTHNLATITVFKINNQLFGERVLPGTLNMKFTLSGNNSFSFTVTDDESGNMRIKELDDRFVGNIFYRNGVLVFIWEEFYEAISESSILEEQGITEDDVKNGYRFLEFSEDAYDNADFKNGEVDFTTYPNFEVPNFEYLSRLFEWRLEFRGELTHYEHQASCTVDPFEFNGVTNPTVIADDDSEEEFIPFFRGDATDINGDPVEFSPFITTIGLYDEFLNLLAIGKLSRPVQKPRDIPITFIVQFDF